MSNVTKTSRIYAYKGDSLHQSTRINQTQLVHHIESKSEAHTVPNKTSGNDQAIVDNFYQETHNLHASFNRLINSEEGEDKRHFFDSHRAEVIAGAKSLVKTINALIEDASDNDISYGTHYAFLIEIILKDFEEDLNTIGIRLINLKVAIDPNQFYDELVKEPDNFNFLFKTEIGLIDRLCKIHFNMTNKMSPIDYEGNIIDFKG